jgi:hypothetical protein
MEGPMTELHKNLEALRSSVLETELIWPVQ